MADRREQILVRLMELGAAVPGIISTHRNSLSVDEEDLPAFVLLDADEEDVVLPPREGRGPPSTYPITMVAYTPEMYLMDGRPVGDTNVGTSVNVLRASFLKALLNDATLKSIIGPNGSIRYRGCATGLSIGRSMQGEMSIYVTFTFPLIPDDL